MANLPITIYTCTEAYSMCCSPLVVPAQKKITFGTWIQTKTGNKAIAEVFHIFLQNQPRQQSPSLSSHDLMLACMCKDDRMNWCLSLAKQATLLSWLSLCAIHKGLSTLQNTHSSCISDGWLLADILLWSCLQCNIYHLAKRLILFIWA